MGISENIDIDINIDRDILSEKFIFFSKKLSFFSCFYDEISILIKIDQNRQKIDENR